MNARIKAERESRGQIEGSVFRTNEGGWEFENSNITDGQSVEIRDKQKGRTVKGVARKLEGGPTFSIENPVVEDDPFPEIVDGKITLPNRSGHAHSRGWQQGDIVRVNGEFYKVTHKPKAMSGGSRLQYTLGPATGEQFARRPGRKYIGTSSYDAPHQVGRAIEIGDEWLEIKDVVRHSYGNSEGEVFGYQYLAKGRFVPESRARQLNARWEAKERVRSLELSLKVAQTSDMHTPESVEAIAKQLEEARAAL